MDNKKKILVVDDEEQILSLLEKKLKSSNYDCYVAAKAKDALELARTVFPDLILLDIALPEMDGYMIAKELKKENATKQIPIIFLTGKDLDPKAISDRVGETGACGYVMKPCSLKDLLVKIGTVLKV